jgi:hypothetical protein
MDPDSGGPKTCGSGPQHWMFYLYILATRGRKARRKRDGKKKQRKIISSFESRFLPSVRHYFVY